MAVRWRKTTWMPHKKDEIGTVYKTGVSKFVGCILNFERALRIEEADFPRAISNGSKCLWLWAHLTFEVRSPLDQKSRNTETQCSSKVITSVSSVIPNSISKWGRFTIFVENTHRTGGSYLNLPCTEWANSVKIKTKKSRAAHSLCAKSPKVMQTG